jgi:cell fate (sporulation/competence/biofilm development) regulator YlbF (YheA/YmcA/DUF963 family)
MAGKLTPKEIKALYEALPTKAHYDAINNAYAQLEKIYGEFVVKHLGFQTVEDAVDQGFMIIYEMQDNIKDLVHALPDHEKLNEFIQYKCDEDFA